MSRPASTSTLTLDETVALVGPVVLRLFRAGAERISIKHAFEIARAESKSEINNTHAPACARRLIQEHPQLRRVIELRALGRGWKHGERAYTVADLRRSFAMGVEWARKNPEVR